MLMYLFALLIGCGGRSEKNTPETDDSGTSIDTAEADTGDVDTSDTGDTDDTEVVEGDPIEEGRTATTICSAGGHVEGSSISGTLPTPLFGTKGMRTSDTDNIVFAGGAAPHSEGTKVIPTSSIRRCVMDDNTFSMQCETLSSLLSLPRFGHEALCLSWAKPTVCQKIVFAGGYNIPKGNVADVYHEDEEGEAIVESLEGSDELSVPGGWKWVDTGDAILSFGGTTGQLGSPADVPPYRVTIEDGVISLEELDLGDAPIDVLYRTFHRVVVTGAGTVLVIGGLDENNQATNSVLRFDSEGNFIDEISMLLPRFGHSATVIETGPMEGSVLVQGGMSLNDDMMEFPIGAEIYGDPGSSP